MDIVVPKGTVGVNLTNANDVYAYGRLIRQFDVIEIKSASVKDNILHIEFEGKLALPEKAKDAYEGHPELPGVPPKEEPKGEGNGNN